MFTVMGITGKVGGAVAENLLAEGKAVRGVTRDPEKAKAWAGKGVQLVKSAYDDAGALETAFAGSEGVFAMIPPDFAPAPGLPNRSNGKTTAVVPCCLCRATSRSLVAAFARARVKSDPRSGERGYNSGDEGQGPCKRFAISMWLPAWW